MAGTIVCGVDDSEVATEVLRVAAALRARLHLRLVVAHAVSAPVTVGVASAPYAYPYPPDPSAAREAAEEYLEHLSAHGDAEGAELRPVVGDPVDSLLTLAQEEEAELIVVGSRGHGPLRAALLGSVSGALASRASCPVVVVPSAPPDGE